MAESIFVDTNVLVYANVAHSPFYQPATDQLKDLYDKGVEIWISRQIIREFFVSMTRENTFIGIVDAAGIVSRLRYFMSRFRVADETEQVTENLLILLEQIKIGRRLVYDANIVATMQAKSINKLLTHNTGDFARFAHLITVVPLQTNTP